MAPVRRLVAKEEKVMNRKTAEQKRSKIRLAVKKETLKDLSTKRPVLGGFIMKDTIIVRTSG